MGDSNSSTLGEERDWWLEKEGRREKVIHMSIIRHGKRDLIPLAAFSFLARYARSLLPATDFYSLDSKSSGTEDVLGIRRHRKCPNCNNKDYLSKDTSVKLIQGALQRARRDGRECSLKPEDIRIPEFCPILGIKMFEAIGEGKKGGSWNDNAPSLDRNDNSKGYTKDNVRVISKKANILKRDGAIEDFLSLLAYLIDTEMGEDMHREDFVPYAKRTIHERVDIIRKYATCHQAKSESHSGESRNS